MMWKHGSGWVVAWAWLASSSVFAADSPQVDFVRDVAPILEAHCIRCHNPGNRRGDLSLATIADLKSRAYLAPHDPEASYLLDLVTADQGQPPAMPQEGTPLTVEQVATLRRWIESGAEWPEGLELRERSKADLTWWSLQPLSQHVPPEFADAPIGWGENPIDRFLLAKLRAEGLAPNPAADRRDLLRRVTYDLTGLPPTPEESAAFLADASPAAYETVVDRLLASPRYGERWGRHWLDVIRFGESRGYERNEIINTLWPFRDYVIRSFNDDKPFDQFVLEHLAGDVVGRDQPDIEIGVAYLVSGPYDDVGNQDAVQAAQIRANTIDEMIRTTGEAFMGLTVGCARCHDHKFDPIRQTDYYSLYATFAGIRHGERVVATTAARQARDAALGPLTARVAALEPVRAKIETEALARAEQHKDELERRWTRPAVSRQLTEEKFPAQPVRHVRLEVLGQEANPYATAGYRIEEFEVWSAEASPRNVALAVNGGQAAGTSRVAGDFSGAYSPGLTIDGQFGASYFAGGPLLTITLPEETTVDRVTFSSDRAGAAGDNPVATFVSEYRLLVSRDGETWNEVANSFDRQPLNAAHRRRRVLDAELSEADRRQLADMTQELAELNRKIAAIPPLPSWWVGNASPAPGPFSVFLGGDPQRPGPPVTPHGLGFLAATVPPYELPLESPESDRRKALAEWLVHPHNPLPPRVLANRLWHYHFGTGLVDTPSDFGYMGGRPTHPELLDWLARQLPLHGWKLKPLHKLILLSQAYQQSAAAREDGLARDASARLLWRFPPRRLSAEELRDTLLSVSGKLNLQMGGPGFKLYQYLQDNVATYVPLDAHGPETYRRAVYHHNARASRIDLMTDFDSPDCAFSTPKRAATTTPLQALTLLNHQFSVDMATSLAERLQQDAGTDSAAQITRVFQLCYSRAPSAEEATGCAEVLQTHGLRALCRALLNSSELMYLN